MANKFMITPCANAPGRNKYRSRPEPEDASPIEKKKTLCNAVSFEKFKHVQRGSNKAWAKRHKPTTTPVVETCEGSQHLEAIQQKTQEEQTNKLQNTPQTKGHSQWDMGNTAKKTEKKEKQNKITQS